MLKPVETAKRVREDIARAKGYLRRDELIRSVSALSEALTLYSQIKLIGAARYEIEVGLDETLVDISRHATIKTMLPPGRDGKPFLLRYVRGKEDILCTALNRMATNIADAVDDAEIERLRKIDEHRLELISRGQEYLQLGDIPRARIFLRRAADEFGAEPGLLQELGEMYRTAGHIMEAAEMFEAAIAQFPRENTAYASAIDCYMEIHEYEKVEKIYEHVLQQFGLHPRTLTNMAKLYKVWRKREKASDCAYRALKMDPKLTEAQEILNELERR